MSDHTKCPHCGSCKNCSWGCRCQKLAADPVNRPSHYTIHPSGVECIDITEHMNFCRGNAIKYVWRAGEKGDELEDLKKARWYLDREICRIEKASTSGERCEKCGGTGRVNIWLGMTMCLVCGGLGKKARTCGR